MTTNVDRDLDCNEKIFDELKEQEQSMLERTAVIPDGGWGWLVCSGTFAVNFIVFGIHNSFGVIYATLLDDHHLGNAETAWIGALAMGLNFLCGPLTSWLCDRCGCRAVAFVGGLLSALGLLLSSFFKKPYVLYLTYGLLFGVGSSLSFVSSIVVLGNYFHRRLALANGVATSGSGVGSLVAGPVINYLLSTTGWQNCMRILSGFSVLLCIAAILYRPNKKIDRSTRSKARCFDLKIWRNKAYVLWVATVALFQFGYLIPFVHLLKYAEDLGIPKSKGAWLIGYLSIASTVGRVLFGKLCDIKKVNRMYVYQFSLFVIGLSTLLCPLASSYGWLIGYSLTFGFFDGCFVGQVAVITADIVGHENLSQGVGNLFGCLAVPMSFGPPVAGWLYEGYRSYDKAFFLSGSVAILSTILIFCVSVLKRNTRDSPVELIDYPNDIPLSKVGTCAQEHNSHLESSGYSSHSQNDDEQLLDNRNDSLQLYYKGPKMREIFSKLERETVL